jgi:hypothetical protein
MSSVSFLSKDDEPEIAGEEAEPAGWRDEQSNETMLDKEQARQILMHAARGGCTAELTCELNVSGNGARLM